MFSFFKLNTTPLVGVDISCSSIKLVALRRVNGQYCLDRYGMELLPPQSIVENSIKDVLKVSEAIRTLVKRLGLKQKFAAISVSGSSVLGRIVQVAADLKDEEIAEQLEIEAERYIPYPLEEVYYDFEVLGPVEKKPKQVKVLLAAARIETLDSRIAAFAETGLKPTVVDLESLAMERAFALLAQSLASKAKANNIAVLDIGSSNTMLYVFHDLQSIYSRDQAFGGKHLTDEIQRRYGLSLEEAVAAQKYGGLPEDYTTEVLASFKETVIQQISRALQIFFSSSEETEIHYILLAGGVALLPGLDTLIQEKIGIKTLIANPFVNMQLGPQLDKDLLMQEAPTFMLACGLALRTFDNE